MSDVTITNLTTSPLYIGDLYATIPASGSIVVQRYASDLPRMKALQDAIANNQAAVSVVPTANELASGLLAADSSVQAVDLQPVAAVDVAAASFEIRKSFTALAAGSVDDITIYAANALPFKMRIMDVYALVSTAGIGGAKTLTVRDQSGGLGTAVATIDDTATGRIAPTAFTGTTLLTPGTLKGLFIRRDQRDVAGEIVIVARRES